MADMIDAHKRKWEKMERKKLRERDFMTEEQLKSEERPGIICRQEKQFNGVNLLYISHVDPYVYIYRLFLT